MWLNKHSKLFLERGYLDEGVTPEQRIRQIAETAESYLGIDGFADKFENYMALGFYSLSTPVWTNYGNAKGLPVSCFNSHISDCIESILEKVSEVGMMSKRGGGTSGFFGELRSRGSKISVGGESSGPVHFMELYDKVADVINQGSSRRGAFAAYLPVDHPDIEEFLMIRSEGHEIQNMSIGVTISDSWMEDMVSGDKEKRRIWGKIIQKRFETGYPYIFFTDTVNNNAPQVYKDKGVKINSSNLCCITGDQRVVTSKGYIKAIDLYSSSSKFAVFDGTREVESSKMQLISENEDVFTITLENGLTHTVTSCHKLPVYDKDKIIGGKRFNINKLVKCQDLKIGDKILLPKEKGLFGNNNMPKEAFLLGLYQADGTQNKSRIHFCLWEKDFDLINEVQECHDYICDKYNTQSVNNKIHPKSKFINNKIYTGNLVAKKSLISNACKKALNFEKGRIPEWIWSSDEYTQWQYIRGLFFADGSVNICKTAKGSPIHLSISSINERFLQELQILLSNLGLHFSLFVNREAGETLLPDGKGGKKIYQTKKLWRLVCGNKNHASIFEKNTGFLKRKGISIDRFYRDNSKKYSKIKSIEYKGKEPVFCVEVDSPEHLWVVNGVVTHNSEITLQSDDKNSFVCVLSSLNLLHWDELSKTDAIETLIYFLDTVNEEFIRKTEGMKFMQTARHFAKTQRALGAGVLGWHSLLQSKMIPFESMAAKTLNNEIWKTIRERADKATHELAVAYGEPELLIGLGRRNVTTLAVAPTTSSSFILGQISPSIEPENSCYYVKKLAKGSFTYKNPFLKKILKEKNIDNDDIWKSILIHGGSVQHLSELSDDEKAVFKTFGEISQKEIVIQAAQRQKRIDQSQSLNLMISHETEPRDVSRLLIDGWRLGIKTFYYQRSSNPAQQLSRSILTCSSCES